MDNAIKYSEVGGSIQTETVLSEGEIITTA
jgi:hypothetical protein